MIVDALWRFHTASSTCRAQFESDPIAPVGLHRRSKWNSARLLERHSDRGRVTAGQKVGSRLHMNIYEGREADRIGSGRAMQLFATYHVIMKYFSKFALSILSETVVLLWHHPFTGPYIILSTTTLKTITARLIIGLLNFVIAEVM